MARKAPSNVQCGQAGCSPPPCASCSLKLWGYSINRLFQWGRCCVHTTCRAVSWLTHVCPHGSTSQPCCAPPQGQCSQGHHRTWNCEAEESAGVGLTVRLTIVSAGGTLCDWTLLLVEEGMGPMIAVCRPYISLYHWLTSRWVIGDWRTVRPT